ncbi:hypothetical protein GCM10007036_35900 [Alsobacter metallidurans]|uniref:Uncharacterized protein n=1 Tax=Alsobacter metallidurans TaxID=340221 RepID=A0A917MIY3_9HYPH|nr:hypothetical protein GCM10007036_35900 [Alsobacter metallidurans]
MAGLVPAIFVLGRPASLRHQRPSSFKTHRQEATLLRMRGFGERRVRWNFAVDLRHPSTDIPGLDPGIHALDSRVDGRDEPGHDGEAEIIDDAGLGSAARQGRSRDAALSPVDFSLAPRDT